MQVVLQLVKGLGKKNWPLLSLPQRVQEQTYNNLILKDLTILQEGPM